MLIFVWVATVLLPLLGLRGCVGGDYILMVCVVVLCFVFLLVFLLLAAVVLLNEN
jgi:hypothetical protein